MAFLLLLHEKMRLKRQVNKLTLKQCRYGNRLERMTKKIEQVQKMYSSRQTKLQKMAQMAQSQFNVWVQNMAGLGSNGLNPYNFNGCGGTSNFILQGLTQWATQGTKDADGNVKCSPEKAQQMLQAYQKGGFQQNLEDGKVVKGKEWKDIDGNFYTADEYTSFNGAYSQISQMQSYRQMQVSQMSQQYQNNISIWLEAQEAQLEAEQDAALAPLEAEQTDMELEKDSVETQLTYAKERLQAIEQACSEGIKDSAPKFGLG